ncbi:MAG TPA: hypothetical protein P5244_13445 [Syntrophales bacterium]|nr:hypothetical protein [Syntrophales bacterium]HRT27857.1 hypothetical protein [Syntrophales bacterium]HRT71613.1 hypothetical protein [Syntrophales bacterium]
MTRYKRLLRLEEEKNGQDVDLTEEQIRFLEKANPCFRERRVEHRRTKVARPRTNGFVERFNRTVLD